MLKSFNSNDSVAFNNQSCIIQETWMALWQASSCGNAALVDGLLQRLPGAKVDTPDQVWLAVWIYFLLQTDISAHWYVRCTNCMC
jgi:hypothetical protein